MVVTLRVQTDAIHPLRHPPEHIGQGLCTARWMVQKVRAPGVHLRLMNIGPALAIPSAKVHFKQGFVHQMAPAP